MAKQPAFMFYNGDWKKDPNLARCSLATRGFWLEILIDMKELKSSKITARIEEFARIARTDRVNARAAIEELQRTKTANVFVHRGEVYKERVTPLRKSDAWVTLECRRYTRELSAAQLHANRQDQYRKRQRPNKSDASVTPEQRESDDASSYSYSYSIKPGDTLPPTPLSPAKERGESAPPEFWHALLFAAQQAGMTVADGQLAQLEQQFARLPGEDRRAAIAGIEIRLKGEYADGAFVPTLKRYLREQLWTARLRPGPRKGAGTDRREAGNREFERRMQEDLANAQRKIHAAGS
jgi:hypothetical protein